MDKETEAITAIRAWIVRETENGRSPAALLTALMERGWSEEQAVEVMTDTLQRRFAELQSKNSTAASARETAPHAAAELTTAALVPAPLKDNSATIIRALDRDVRVLCKLESPQLIVFGGLLADNECDELVAQARRHLSESNVIDVQTGGEQQHEHRTSSGMAFTRGATPLITRIERRIAALLGWPIENGEALQILQYAVGQEYRPHYDYMDPTHAGAAPFLARGGQRVASLVMYLNTPTAGGATNFPDIGLEVSAVKGNAVFFSYDRAHPATKTLHGGMPVKAGEKWVATKWLRESAHH